MLVLTRKVNQQIRLGDSITVTVLRVQGNSIRIGIEAPKEVRVVRGELEPRSTPGEAIERIESQEPVVAGETTEPLPAWMPTGGMLEFDLDDLDAESIEALKAAVEAAPETPCIYQMKTKAPLARFFPPAVRQSAGSYTV